MSRNQKDRPAILAPAGNKDSFLAALAAGADAVYCGLKMFSARMAADNFSIPELAGLTRLAHEQGTSVHVALNTQVKPNELEKAGRLIARLARDVKPDALIIQDLAMIPLAKKAGFKGALHLSTLANLSFPEGMDSAKGLGLQRVVVPRELSVDELRQMADACPEGMDLEAFIHGALCYAVSGRCYWSSFLGGKSGVRGRCVQPCRRIYAGADGKERYFSMMDLSLDVLTKVLGDIPEIRCWKVEGRKKGPHYVYYTTTAYQMLRDERQDAGKKKVALGFLEGALGRPGMHYNFLPQRPWHPIRAGEETGSGRFAGRVKGKGRDLFLAPRFPLLGGDLLRVGYDEDPSHFIQRVPRSVPKGGRFHLKPKGRPPQNGTPVFLLDRRERELEAEIRSLDERLAAFPEKSSQAVTLTIRPPRKGGGFAKPQTMVVRRSAGKEGSRSVSGLWVNPERMPKMSADRIRRTWWWVSPALWPKTASAHKEALAQLVEKGARRFVLNAPWQVGLFDSLRGLELWAGPFCNVANGMAVQVLKDMGFSGVIASPELNREDFLALPEQSPLPVGVVISGLWPEAISRVLAPELGDGSFLKSPKGEGSWVKQHGENYWIYPDWPYDISEKRRELMQAGYGMFVEMDEPVPRGITIRKRPGLWNWNLRLL